MNAFPIEHHVVNAFQIIRVCGCASQTDLSFSQSFSILFALFPPCLQGLSIGSRDWRGDRREGGCVWRGLVGGVRVEPRQVSAGNVRHGEEERGREGAEGVGVSERGVDEGRGGGGGAEEVAADDKGLEGGGARGAGLDTGHVGEEKTQLREEKRNLAAAKHLCHERAAGGEQETGDGEGGQHQLGLHVLVHVVETRHVGGAVADDELGGSAETGEHGLGSGGAGNVALQHVHAGERSHLLEIDGDERGAGKTLGQQLRPGAGSGAEIDTARNAGKDAEFLLNVKKLVGRASTIAVWTKKC